MRLRPAPGGESSSSVLRALGVEDGKLTDEDRFSLFLYEPFWLLGGIVFGVAAWEHRRSLRRSELRG